MVNKIENPDFNFDFEVYGGEGDATTSIVVVSVTILGVSFFWVLSKLIDKLSNNLKPTNMSMELSKSSAKVAIQFDNSVNHFESNIYSNELKQKLIQIKSTPRIEG